MLSGIASLHCISLEGSEIYKKCVSLLNATFVIFDIFALMSHCPIVILFGSFSYVSISRLGNFLVLEKYNNLNLNYLP
jgi:hypothetical protein